MDASAAPSAGAETLPAEPVAQAAPVARRRRALALAARIVFTVAILVAVGYTTVSQWRAVRTTITSLAWPAVALSFALVLVGLAAQTMAFRAALGDVGHRVSPRTAGHIYLIGLLAKYLPGSAWTFVLQMELGRRVQIPRSRGLVASLVSLGLSTTAALLLGVLGLPVLFDVNALVTALVVACVPVAVVCAHPRVLTWLVQRMLALLRRPPLANPFTWRGVLATTGWSALAWAFFGVHLWLLASAGAAPGFGGLMRCVSAFALGLTAGILAFLSPSGLGVRETIITAALLPYLPYGVALGMALASRMIFTAADVTAAGVAAFSLLRWSRRADQAPAS
jgi:hypothetical protein